MNIEEKIKAKLSTLGFDERVQFNQRFLIGATINETILAMKEEQIIDLLDKVRKEPNRRSLVKTKLLGLFAVSNYPDLTDVWNLAEKLHRTEQITVWEMNEIWGALTELQKEGKCKLADSLD